MIKKQSYSKKLQAPEKLIEWSLDKGSLKTLAFYNIIKSIFQNSVVYRYTPQEIANIYNLRSEHKMSANLISMHMKVLKDWGWIKKQKLKDTRKSNYWFLSIEKIYWRTFQAANKHKSTIIIHKNYNMKDVEAILIHKLIQKHSKQHLYKNNIVIQAIEKRKREESIRTLHNRRRGIPNINLFKLKQYVKRTRLQGLSEFDENLSDSNSRQPYETLANKLNSVNFETIIKDEYGHLHLQSYQSLADTMKITKSYLYARVKHLKKLGLIKTQTIKTRLADTDRATFKEYIQSKSKVPFYVYYHKGFVNTCLGTSFTYSDNHITNYSKFLQKDIPTKKSLIAFKDR